MFVFSYNEEGIARGTYLTPLPCNFHAKATLITIKNLFKIIIERIRPEGRSMNHKFFLFIYFFHDYINGKVA